MKLMKFFLIVYFSLISYSFSYEDKRTFEKRINISKQISYYSNNTISLVASHYYGISGVAKEYIEKNQPILKIPKKFTLCTSYLFPFKFEIVNFLLDITNIKERVGKDNKLTTFLLTYYILYYMYAPKEKIKKYILEKNLSQYYNSEITGDVGDELLNYFPNVLSGSGMLDLEHEELLFQLGFKVTYGYEIEEVFKKVNKNIDNLDYKHLVLPWTSNYDNFKWAYSMVMSRSFSVNFNDYMKLQGLNTQNLVLSQSSKKNHEVNIYISPPNQTGSCMLAFVDLFNHYQPRKLDLSDKKGLPRYTEEGYFIFLAPHDLNPGDEIQHTYVSDAQNLFLFFNYGFVISNNIFNIHGIKVRNDKLNLSQLGLCKELKCYEFDENDPWKIPETRIYNVRLSVMDRNLLNYGRILFLNKNYDKKSVLKSLSSNTIISYENEAKAWIYYYRSILYNSEINLLEKSLRSCQHYRNIVRNIEEDWINEETKKEAWKRNKIYENIYLMHVSYKKITTKHMLGSINQVILNSNTEIEKFKEKYFL